MSSSSSSSGSADSAPIAGAWGAHPFAYPSVDPGFPSIELNDLLGAHADLIGRIKVCFGVDRGVFETEVMTLVRRYAAYVHLLPATPDNYFNIPGGLLQLGLETAFFALQGTDAHIFSGRATITTRRHLEPRWRLATFAAGLCAEIHRTVGRVVVTNEQGDEWPAYMMGLEDWLESKTITRYYLKWVPNASPTPGLSLFALPHIVPAQTLQHLAKGNSVVVPHLMASLTSTALVREHNILDELVRRAAALVIDRFLRASADRYGKPLLGSHLERYLVDGLRRLTATEPAWQPNTERSRIWLATDGLFIVWPQAAADLRKLLEGDRLPGIPKAPDTMLEILMRAGVLEPRSDGGAIWEIQPPGAKGPVEAVKLAASDLVVVGLDPKPEVLGQALCIDTSKVPEAQDAHSGKGPAQGHAPTGVVQDVQLTEPTAQPILRPEQLALDTDSQWAIPQQEPSVVLSADAVSPDGRTSVAAAPGSAAGGESPAPLAPPRTPLALAAPMRLSPEVRAALDEQVALLDEDESGRGSNVMAAGLFVPLDAFDKRGMSVPSVVRALLDAGMLVDAASHLGPIQTHCIGDRQQRGLVIGRAFIEGLPARP